MVKLCFLMLVCSLAGCGRQNEEKIDIKDNPVADFRNAPTRDTTIVFNISRRDKMLNFTQHILENETYAIEWKSWEKKFFFICKSSYFDFDKLLNNVFPNGGTFVFPNGKTVNIEIEGGRKVFNPDPLPNWE